MGKAYYSLYFNEQWCYKDANSGDSVEKSCIVDYIHKVLNGGIYYSPSEHVFFISSDVMQRKGETPSIRLDTDDIIADNDLEGSSMVAYSKYYVVDYIFSNNDNFIYSLKNDMQPLGSYIREGKAIQKQTLLLSSKDLLSGILNANIKNIVCAAVDAMLSGKSVVLYGQEKKRKDFLNIIFYSLRCLPPKLANSIIINTNMKNGVIDKTQFIGCMTSCTHCDGVCFIDISNTSKKVDKLNNFYTVYLERLISVQGVLDFSAMECCDDNETIIKRLNILAINNMNLEETVSSLGDKISKPEADRVEQLVTIIKRMSNGDILKIIEDNSLITEKRSLLERWIRNVDSLKYIYICNATKLHENINDADFVMNESKVKITVGDLLEIEKFYKEYSTDKSALEFVKKGFLLCLSKIESFDERSFVLAYNLKIYLNIDVSEMGFAFVDKVHHKFRETERVEANGSKTEGARLLENKASNPHTKKWFIQSSAFVSAISLIIPILIGTMLLTVPDKIWKYFAIIMNVDTWYIMPIVLGCMLLLAFAFYLIPYFIMRRNTVHLNGFSNVDSTGVSCVCMLAVLIPMVIFVVCAAIA